MGEGLDNRTGTLVSLSVNEETHGDDEETRDDEETCDDDGETCGNDKESRDEVTSLKSRRRN